MQTYTTKTHDTLDRIAKKFNLPSWKYLYSINKQAIGSNPDLLKEGIKLDIPEWDSTGGDEKIQAKGFSASSYTGGLSYKYPWVPVSFTIGNSDGTVYKEKDANGKEQTEFKKKKKYEIKDAKTGNVLASGEISKAEEINVLVPNVKKKVVVIDGKEFQLWNGEIK